MGASRFKLPHHAEAAREAITVVVRMPLDRLCLQIDWMMPHTPAMRDFRISPRGMLWFCLFIVLFGAAMKLDDTVGHVRIVWTILVWSGLLLGSLLLVARLFAARHDPETARRIQAQGAYGLLPARLRDWLFS